jgi:hypothetical protein
MPVTFTDMCADDLVPMRAVYQRTKVTPEDVAKARAEALLLRQPYPALLASVFTASMYSLNPRTKISL